MSKRFDKNLADGIEFEDFIHNSGLIYDLFPAINIYSDTRNHTIKNFKGPRLYVRDNKDYELPDFQLYMSTGIIWLEAKSKQSGSFPYTIHGQIDQYFSLDRSKFNSYKIVTDLTNAYGLYIIFGDMVTNKIYLYQIDDMVDFAWLKMSKFSDEKQLCPLYLASSRFLVAEITDYVNNQYKLIKNN